MGGALPYLKPRNLETSDPTLVGKVPINTAEQTAKLYAEYETPLEGLFVTGGVNWVGSQYADSLNTNPIPAYMTLDLGLRYNTKVNGTPLIFRVNATNLSDERYWLNSTELGLPLTVSFSMTAKL